ncbi:hypothetical protein [Bradyrhizobium sp. 1(2017)]|uniref:hypothetical protein n=1 Tax=Bradyrhizobium sp. 1(2017) TaxID=1404888 RepID=UPI00140F214C|nr:hypothetical protein [Bradyrhizobium sp. 1(2017)]QIO34202.1 hypothetical protein HAP40_21610 [Bradyrhizobium sp. 1(2017)]
MELRIMGCLPGLVDNPSQKELFLLQRRTNACSSWENEQAFNRTALKPSAQRIVDDYNAFSAYERRRLLDTSDAIWLSSSGTLPNGQRHDSEDDDHRDRTQPIAWPRRSQAARSAHWKQECFRGMANALPLELRAR